MTLDRRKSCVKKQRGQGSFRFFRTMSAAADFFVCRATDGRGSGAAATALVKAKYVLQYCVKSGILLCEYNSCSVALRQTVRFSPQLYFCKDGFIIYG